MYFQIALPRKENARYVSPHDPHSSVSYVAGEKETQTRQVSAQWIMVIVVRVAQET